MVFSCFSVPLQVWSYDEGYCYYMGEGHSGEITACNISPDQETIVSVGTEGAIFLWTMPQFETAELQEGDEDAGGYD